jgi:hypothetical protein
VLASLRRRGLPTSQWNYATMQAMEKASRLEFLALFKKHDLHASYALIELIRTAEPDTFVERWLKEKQAAELMALIPMMFIGTI